MKYKLKKAVSRTCAMAMLQRHQEINDSVLKRMEALSETCNLRQDLLQAIKEVSND